MKSIANAYLHMLKKPAHEAIVEQTQQIVNETTVPEKYHSTVESWNHHGDVDDKTYEKMSKALRGGFTHFPLETSTSEADADVVEHLTNHGYEIKNYRAGIATKKITVGDPSRGIPLRDKHVEEKIGSILEKTGAHPDVKAAFMNDPARAASKSTQQKHVVVSTTPLAIAGMSTGVNWQNQSCMNMVSGGQRGYLAHDSLHGTHVAYLCDHDDETAFKHGEPSKPLSRIALKPYHSDSGDTIFRAEDKTWGVNNSAFSRAVNQWANENYPAISGETYHKNPNVYDDTDNNVYRQVTNEDMENTIDHIYRHTPSETFDSAMDHHVIDHGLKYMHVAHPVTNDMDTNAKKEATEKQLRTLNAISHIKNLSTGHVAKILKHIEPHLNSDDRILQKDASTVYRNIEVYHGDKVPTKVLDVTVDSGKTLTNTMLMNPKLKDYHIESLDPSRLNLVRRSKINSHHMDRLVDAYVKDPNSYGLSRCMNDLTHKLNSDHIYKAINAGSGSAQFIVDSPDFTKEHHQAWVDKYKSAHDVPNVSFGFKHLLSQSPHASIDDFHKGTVRGGVELLLGNKRVGESEIKKAKDYIIANATGGNPEKEPTRWINSVIGMSKNVIPERMSEAMTKSDFEKLAAHRYRATFENQIHSNQYLDEIHKQAKKYDQAISDHIAKQYDNDDYDESEDPHVHHLKAQLEHHMQSYGDNIDDHIDEHVAKNNDINWNEHEKTLGRFEFGNLHPHSVHNLEHYETPENSGRGDHEHYNDHINTVHDRLYYMTKHNSRYD